MDGERLRISGFSNRAWAEHAIAELRDLGFSAELDLSRGEGVPYAVIVCGCGDKLELLRSLADSEGEEPDCASGVQATPAGGTAAGAAPAGAAPAAPAPSTPRPFEWSEFVNSMDGLLRS